MATRRPHPAAGARTSAALLSLAAFGGLGLAFDLAAQETAATASTTDESGVATSAVAADTATDADTAAATTTTWAATTTSAATSGSTGAIESRTSGS